MKTYLSACCDAHMNKKKITFHFVRSQIFFAELYMFGSLVNCEL